MSAGRESGWFQETPFPDSVAKNRPSIPRSDPLAEPRAKDSHPRLNGLASLRRGIVAGLFLKNLFVELGHALFLSANVTGGIIAVRSPLFEI